MCDGFIYLVWVLIKMNRKIFNYFEIAAKLTTAKRDGRAFLLGACVQRKDGVIVTSINSPSHIPERTAHAEYRAAKKADVGSIIYVVRVRLLNGEFAMARPCRPCMKMLINKGISKVYYTIDSYSYGTIDLKTMKERTDNGQTNLLSRRS